MSTQIGDMDMSDVLVGILIGGVSFIGGYVLGIMIWVAYLRWRGEI